MLLPSRTANRSAKSEPSGSKANERIFHFCHLSRMEIEGVGGKKWADVRRNGQVQPGTWNTINALGPTGQPAAPNFSCLKSRIPGEEPCRVTRFPVEEPPPNISPKHIHPTAADQSYYMHTYPQKVYLDSQDRSGYGCGCGSGCGMWAAETSWKSFMSSKLISFDSTSEILHLGWAKGNWFRSCLRCCCSSQVDKFAYGSIWNPRWHCPDYILNILIFVRSKWPKLPENHGFWA